MEIAEFLLARVAEAEAYATYVQQEAAGRTHWAPPWTPLNPAHVLAECEAKRQIVEEHSLYGEGEFWGDDKPQDDQSLACRRCGYPREFAAAWPCKTLRLLALPYADHPDYNPEWKA